MSETKFEEVETKVEETVETENTQESNEAEESEVTTEVKNFGFIHKLTHPHGFKGWATTITVAAGAGVILYFGGKHVVKKIGKSSKNDVLMKSIAEGFGEGLDEKLVDAAHGAMLDTLAKEGVQVLNTDGSPMNEIAEEAIKKTIQTTSIMKDSLNS